jgi:hypothetical protein
MTCRKPTGKRFWRKHNAGAKDHHVIGALLGKALLALALVFGVVNTNIFNALASQVLKPKLTIKGVIVIDRPVFTRVHPQNALKKSRACAPRLAALFTGFKPHQSQMGAGKKPKTK